MNLFGGAIGIAAFVLLLGLAVQLQASLPSFVEEVEAEGRAYLVCRLKHKLHRLELYWQKNGKPIETFRKLFQHVQEQKGELLLATNGGIFEPGYEPTGLHVENGQELLPLNKDSGKGNFYLEPNGVFFIQNEKPAIMSTKEYAQTQRKPEIAFQSGPLLLRQGNIHHRFRKESTSVYIRSGIGLTDEGKVVLVLSEEKVNLYSFALFFKKTLKCTDALYLDGGISQFFIPGRFTLARKRRYAGFLAILSRQD